MYPAKISRYSHGFLLYTRATPYVNIRRLVTEERIDIILRALIAIFYPGPERLDDVFAIVVHEPKGQAPISLLFVPECLPREQIVEQKAMALKYLEVLSRQRCKILPDIGYREVIEMLRGWGFNPVILLEKGKPFTQSVLWQKPVFVVGTNVDPPLALQVESYSLGESSYLTTQVIAYINLLYLLGKSTGASDEG